MIHCVVFDCDGTLIDSNRIKAQLFYQVLREWDPEGHAVDEAFHCQPEADRYGLMKAIAETLERDGRLPVGRAPSEWAKEWAETYSRRCEDELAHCPESRGSGEILRELTRRRIPLFVNSGTPTHALKRVLERRSIDRYFAGIYGVPPSKLENLRRIQEVCGARPEEILFVGDTEGDRMAADQFACRFVGVCPEDTALLEPSAGKRITDLRELSTLIRGIDESQHDS